MGLMQIRQKATNDMARKWPFSLFQGPSSWGKVFMYSAAAVVIGSYSLLSMIVEGNEGAGLGFLFAAVIGLVAHAHWLRLEEARESELLPERILCPSCKASITLSEEERRGQQFACPACSEDFEIVDEA